VAADIKRQAQVLANFFADSSRPLGRHFNRRDYVCNYSMFVLLEEIDRRQLRTSFGFIHIPYDFDHRKACRIVDRILRKFALLRVSEQLEPAFTRLRA
jgi:hypothetical protein